MEACELCLAPALPDTPLLSGVKRNGLFAKLVIKKQTEGNVQGAPLSFWGPGTGLTNPFYQLISCHPHNHTEWLPERAGICT